MGWFPYKKGKTYRRVEDWLLLHHSLSILRLLRLLVSAVNQRVSGSRHHQHLLLMRHYTRLSGEHLRVVVRHELKKALEYIYSAC